MNGKIITNLDTNTNDDLSAVNVATLKGAVTPKADKTVNYVHYINQTETLTLKKNII